MGAFHHATPGLEACFFFDGLRLFAPAAKLLQISPHLIEVVTPASSTGQALIQAQTLGCSPLGSGRCTSRLSTVARTSLMSWRLAPATASGRARHGVSGASVPCGQAGMPHAPGFATGHRERAHVLHHQTVPLNRPEPTRLRLRLAWLPQENYGARPQLR